MQNVFFYIKYILLTLVVLNSFYAKADNTSGIEAELIPHCGMTQGGVATATPDGKIYYCAQRMADIEYKFPGAGSYFILHEYGHIFLQSGNEREVDCWTANELAINNSKEAKKILVSAMKFLKLYKLYDPKYGGTGEDRAQLIQNCFKNGADYYKNN
tara:strand:- start:1647 stop:2117 length:471 start_codon:yes stop_codon:yes gene_type:complete